MENFQNHSTAKYLKKNAIQRILTNMIEDIKNGDPTKGRPDIPFLLIILDDNTSKILSSYVTMSDVLNKGIFSVEKLEIGRQKFPNYQALYFISPTRASIDLVLKDFEDKANPQYKRVHLFFSSTLMDSNLGLLATEKLYPRIATCKELNLSFFCRNKNLFDFGLNDFLDIFATKSDKDKERDKIAVLAERLFSACSVLNEFPYIQYQKNSPFCHEVAFSLNAKLKGLYSDRSDYTRGLMLITDRTLDICTPLLHDYSYESLLYDLLKQEEFVVKSNDDKKTSRKIDLDEKDEIWNKYRTAHIAEVFEKISKEASDFYNMVKGREGKSNEKNNKEFDEMKKALREAKSMKSKSEAFNFHIESCQTLGTVNL
jgi:syntaxin-binding protein 1